MNGKAPLQYLLAFDAAMRHMSFARAAQELCITPGAISQQIQKLELWLGFPLFVREYRQVRATEEARAYWALVQPGLNSIQQASQRLRNLRTNEVRLSLPPTLAAKWFTPRMGGFLEQHPHIQLHLIATASVLDIQREDVDLVIRLFDGNDPALEATLLLQNEARVFCAPGYLQRYRLDSVQDLRRATLLQDTLHAHWPEWLQRYAGLNSATIEQMGRLHFNQTGLAIDASVEGLGVLLCNGLLVEAELRRGLLIEPFPHTLALQRHYFLAHRRGVPLRAPADALKRWLLG